MPTDCPTSATPLLARALQRIRSTPPRMIASPPTRAPSIVFSFLVGLTPLLQSQGGQQSLSLSALCLPQLQNCQALLPFHRPCQSSLNKTGSRILRPALKSLCCIASPMPDRRLPKVVCATLLERPMLPFLAVVPNQTMKVAFTQVPHISLLELPLVDIACPSHAPDLGRNRYRPRRKILFIYRPTRRPRNHNVTRKTSPHDPLSLRLPPSHTNSTSSRSNPDDDPPLGTSHIACLLA